MKEGKFVNSAVINGFVNDAEDANKVEGGANGGVKNEDTKAEEIKKEHETIDKIANSMFKK